ncbi:MAG: NAD-dependent epimerase/dehydratase family protein [Myxococcota bacterium]
MDLVVLGGTRFAGGFFTEAALDAGHRVTVVHRGLTGRHRAPQAEHVFVDRVADPGLTPLAGRRFDAAVDFCGFFPRVVAGSADRLADASQYVFVSSISAHRDPIPVGATEDAPVYEPPFPEREAITETTYGPLKVACERVVTDRFGVRASIVRPGFIVGPTDPSDRFTSLVRRAAAGGTMVAPGPSDAPLQFVDARDLAAFLLRIVERGPVGIVDAVHPAGTATIGQVLEAARAAVGADTRIAWADPLRLSLALGPARESAFPLWDPDDRIGAFHRLAGSRAAAAGLRSRPIADTIADLVAWDAASGRPVYGLAPDREAALLASL